MNAETRTLVSQATAGSVAPGAHLVDQSLAVVRTDPEGRGALLPVAPQLGEALDLRLAAQGVADDLAPRLAQAL